VKLWLVFLLIVAAGVGLAWAGTREVRDNVVAVETVKAGSGALIGPNDGVLIEYEGRLENGTVFDASGERGPVPLLASQVIPGFSQALAKMQKGGRYKIRIPSQLAYGASPPPGSPIPPNADLEFDVHVVQIVPNAALMQGPPPQQ
jgi:FKBP-type peptidyl-prolyl cis-trans isomerase FkpA